MNWPVPQAGMLINYSYLWGREAAIGQEEGIKDRPCAVVIAKMDKDGKLSLRVLPVTHRPPLLPDEAVEIPAPIKARLGLDEARSWIVLSELNEFTWPGPDVRPLERGGSPIYGFLPNNFFRHILQQMARRRVRVTRRT